MAARLKTIGPRVATLDTRRVKPAPKQVDDFYSSAAWKQLREAVKAERGHRCQRADHTCSGRLMVDHVIERRDGGADFDRRNLVVLCEHHHAVKTAAARATRMAR